MADQMTSVTYSDAITKNDLFSAGPGFRGRDSKVAGQMISFKLVKASVYNLMFSLKVRLHEPSVDLNSRSDTFAIKNT